MLFQISVLLSSGWTCWRWPGRWCQGCYCDRDPLALVISLAHYATSFLMKYFATHCCLSLLLFDESDQLTNTRSCPLTCFNACILQPSGTIIFRSRKTWHGCQKTKKLEIAKNPDPLLGKLFCTYYGKILNIKKKKKTIMSPFKLCSQQMFTFVDYMQECNKKKMCAPAS